MRFFTMEQDKRLPDVIQFRDFDIRGPRHIFYKEDAGEIQQSNMMYLTKDSGETAPDFIQSPVYLVSDKVKAVLDMYEDDMVAKWYKEEVHGDSYKNMLDYFQNAVVDPAALQYSSKCSDIITEETKLYFTDAQDIDTTLQNIDKRSNEAIAEALE